MPKEEKINEFLIVPELPQTPVRKVQGEDGETYELVTRDEAAKEILEKIRVIFDKVNKIA